MGKRSFALLLLCLGVIFAMPLAAQADTPDIIQPQNETFDQGFQAGTCTQEQEAGKNCSVETPTIYYTTAAGHPPIGFTQYTIAHEPYVALEPPFPAGSVLAPIKEPLNLRTIKTLRSDLPPGLTVNPEATPSRCPISSFLNSPSPGIFEPTCDPETITGEEKVTLVTNKNEVEIDPVNAPGFKPPKGFVIPPTPGNTLVSVYNLVPKEGEPAKLGFVIGKKIPVFLETEVAWESDFHESFTIKLLNTAEVSGLSTLISRLVAKGRSGDGTYLTNPTTCFDPNDPAYEHLYSTWFRAESYGDPDPEFPHGSTPVEAKLPKVGGLRVQQTGCDTVPFDPTVDVAPNTNSVDSPSPATVTTKMPFDPATEGNEGQMQSHVRKAEVSLPNGMGLNPAGAQGLKACTDAEFEKGVRTYTNKCPPESDIGTVEVESAPLAEPLIGDVFVGEQQSNDPESGNQFRILLEAKSLHEGINARLVGHVKANKTTGNLTAVIDDQLSNEFFGPLPSGLPQVPFKEIRVHLDGSKQVLTSPPICSATGTSHFEPWARPGESKPVD